VAETTVNPPDRAKVESCPDCRGVAGQACYECHGRGVILIRACPACGNPGWDYINGTDDRDGMTCASGCGHLWAADDPGWLAQSLPQMGGAPPAQPVSPD